MLWKRNSRNFYFVLSSVVFLSSYFYLYLSRCLSYFFTFWLIQLAKGGFVLKALLQIAIEQTSAAATNWYRVRATLWRNGNASEYDQEVARSTPSRVAINLTSLFYLNGR